MNTVFEKKSPSYISGKYFTFFDGFPPMFHAHIELIYVKKGSIRTTIDGVTHTLQEGELCALFPYLPHSYEDSEAEGVLLLVDPGVTAFNNTLLTKKPVRYHTDGRALAPLLERAVYMLKKGKFKTTIGYLNAVIGELLEIMPLEDTPDVASNMVIRILEYCAENFSQPLTLQTVADALFVSPSYVSKIFSQRLKRSFREYINALRMERAKTLLTETALPIGEVMFSCGFSNQSSFNRVFQDFCGCSPREFKRQLTKASLPPETDDKTEAEIHAVIAP